VSDNEGAEVVGHQVGLATSGTGSFEAGAAGVLDTLGGLGIDVAGAEVYDGSGLSRRNRVSTSLLIDLIQHAAGPGGEGMRSLVTGMPVAGFTGSLTYRFADGPAVARGLVRAKTGTLTGVHALAGIAVDRDGQPLAFVFGADKSPPIERYDSQEALDRAAASLASCRCSG
jgi:D-alanyl-D-alanine carboxypeptidase/D-alanyl-D-alanine-endopeptidase (penicillin-binding protein 4)